MATSGINEMRLFLDLRLQPAVKEHYVLISGILGRMKAEAEAGGDPEDMRKYLDYAKAYGMSETKAAPKKAEEPEEALPAESQPEQAPEAAPKKRGRKPKVPHVSNV